MRKRNQYVRKSLKEWSEDLELCLVNSKKRQIAKSTVCGIFKELINTGIVTYINCYSKLRAYNVCEEVLIQMLREKIGLEFESNSKHLNHRTLERKNNKTKRDVNRSEHSDKNETELNYTKNIAMLNETEQEPNTKPLLSKALIAILLQVHIQIINLTSQRTQMSAYEIIEKKYFWGGKLWTQSYFVETIC